MIEVTIRKWGDNWWVQADGETTSTGTFADALQWASAALEPGGDPILVYWGLPLDSPSQPAREHDDT